MLSGCEEQRGSERGKDKNAPGIGCCLSCFLCFLYVMPLFESIFFQLQLHHLCSVCSSVCRSVLRDLLDVSVVVVFILVSFAMRRCGSF